MFHRFRSAGLRMHDKFTEKLQIQMLAVAAESIETAEYSVNDDEEAEVPPSSSIISETISKISIIENTDDIIDESEVEIKCEYFNDETENCDEDDKRITNEKLEMYLGEQTNDEEVDEEIDFLEDEFQLEIEKDDSVKRQLKCAFCHKTFTNTKELNAHKRNDHQFK